MTLKNTPTNFSHKFKALQLTFQVVYLSLSGTSLFLARQEHIGNIGSSLPRERSESGSGAFDCV